MTQIALGVGAAYLYSLVATVAPGLFPEGFRAGGGAVMPYFDTAVVITVLVLLGLLTTPLVLHFTQRTHDRLELDLATRFPDDAPLIGGH